MPEDDDIEICGECRRYDGDDTCPFYHSVGFEDESCDLFEEEV